MIHKKNRQRSLLGIGFLMLCLVLLAARAAGCGGKKRAPEAAAERVTVRVGSLKGPTTMGLLFLMEDSQQKKTENQYEFQMVTGADQLLALMVKGELDMALVPANVAAILYRKMEGMVSVIDINTLSVLYLVSSDEGLGSVEDLKGRTVYLTGKGTGPDYVLRYLIREAGLEPGEVTLEYLSEAAEVAATLAKKPEAAGFLPQPFVTAACLQNEALKVVCSAAGEWNRLGSGEGTSGEGYGPVTGVTVVRKDFMEAHADAVGIFLKEHALSAEAINADPDTGAAYCVKAGILAKENIAREAIPRCGITCITGEEMKRALEEYLSVLYSYSPETVGGELPEEEFYAFP